MVLTHWDPTLYCQDFHLASTISQGTAPVSLSYQFIWTHLGMTIGQTPEQYILIIGPIVTVTVAAKTLFKEF